MDELTIDGKTYLSSKRAAALTGYAKDYIGQLCCEGRVEARLVGRSWYVYEPSIMKHRFSDDKDAATAKEAEEAPIPNMFGGPVEKVETSEKTNVQAVWEAPSYHPEEVKILPELEEQPVIETVSEAASEAAPTPLGDMQSAWQEWFATRKEPTEATTVEKEEEIVAASPARDQMEEEPVAIRTVVSDIQPIQPLRQDPAPSIRIERELAHVQAPVRNKKRKSVRNRTFVRPAVVSALLIAVIVVSISITLISTGAIDALHIGSTQDIGALQLITGTSVVNK